MQPIMLHHNGSSLPGIPGSRPEKDLWSGSCPELSSPCCPFLSPLPPLPPSSPPGCGCSRGPSVALSVPMMKLAAPQPLVSGGGWGMGDQQLLPRIPLPLQLPDSVTPGAWGQFWSISFKVCKYSRPSFGVKVPHLEFGCVFISFFFFFFWSF